MKDNTAFKFDIPEHQQSIIKVIGVGGGGSNAVEHMHEQGIKDVEFIICNTDSQHLHNSLVHSKLQIGLSSTEGLGAGADPEAGRQAALESKEEIRDLLSDNTKMLFITAGMGGGTGTGAAPVIAQIAKDLGILTVGIVTAPFKWEGRKKMRYANNGIDELKATCDTVLVILNDKLKEAYPSFAISEAFSKADDVLTTAAKSIAEIVTKNIKVNVDFNDVHKVMFNAGTAVMGSSEVEYQEGVNVALKAGEEAIVSPLLNNADISGAERVLLTITHGENVSVSMEHFEELNDYIIDQVGEEVEEEVIFGLGVDPELGDAVKVTIVATGFEDKDYAQKPKYVNLNADRQRTEITSNATFGNKFNKPEAPTNSIPEPERDSMNSNSIDARFEVSESHAEELETKNQPSLFDNEPDAVSERVISFDLDNDTFNPNQFSKDASEEVRDDSKNRIRTEIDEPVNERSEPKEDQVAKDRREKLEGMSMNISGPLTDKEIKEKLDVPAYKRRKVNLNKDAHSSESEISRFTLNEDDEILGNNRFLHDNVD